MNLRELLKPLPTDTVHMSNAACDAAVIYYKSVCLHVEYYCRAQVASVVYAS